MKTQNALQLFGLDSNPDLDLIKTTYRKLCIKFHPDRNPAGAEMMKAVNVAKGVLIDALNRNESLFAADNADNAYADHLSAAINAVIDLGLDIEICGDWVWVTGDTKPHKDVFKAAGYYWSRKKVAWYYRPANYKSRSRGKFSMDEIRDMHGSRKVNGRSRTAIPTS